ncbi:hypothetical protein NS220_06765 [Microbacterium testaceum]|uniref:DUF732 domain-containing protein n=1 Tax=Microbacterium testaceum TaxID=2033 RepID=A0A147EYA9_MICTE|nr:hypothetical protein NS220_06765 [Microbacterium testaceum]
MFLPSTLALLLVLAGCVYTQDAGEQSGSAPPASPRESGTGDTVPAESADAVTDAPVDRPADVPTDEPSEGQPIEDQGSPGGPIAAPDEDTSGASDMLTAIRLTVAQLGVDVGADRITAAADYTCDQLAAGADRGGIVALTGGLPAGANETLVQLAADEYCPIR